MYFGFIRRQSMPITTTTFIIQYVCKFDQHFLLQTWTLCWDIQDTWTSEWDGRRELEAQSGPVLSLWLSPPDLRSNSSYFCTTSGEVITRDNSRGSGKLGNRKRLYNKTVYLHVGTFKHARAMTLLYYPNTCNQSKNEAIIKAKWIWFWHTCTYINSLWVFEEVEINNESPVGFCLAYCVPSFQLSADRFLRYR